MCYEHSKWRLLTMASKKNGLIQELGPNGQVIKETEYIEGKKHGVQTCYDPDGNPVKITTYENNVRVYEETYYKGLIVSKTPYFMGKKEGLVELFEKGVKVSETNYANGKKDGIERCFYADGSVESIMHYESGKKLEDYEHYYPNGQPCSIVKNAIRTGYGRDNGIPTMQTGFVNGIYFVKSFYASGVLGYYREGTEEHYYDPSGQEISNEEYFATELFNFVGDHGNGCFPIITQEEYIQKRDKEVNDRNILRQKEETLYGHAVTPQLSITKNQANQRTIVKEQTEGKSSSNQYCNVNQPVQLENTPKLGFFGKLIEKIRS